MPNIKSAKKRVLVAEVRNARNKANKSALKTAIKKFEAAAVEGNKVVYSMTAMVNGAEAAELAKTSSSVTLGTGTTGMEDLDAALVGDHRIFYLCRAFMRRGR